jgi:hypothetical protein
MADDPNANAAPAAGQVQNLGETTRITPTTEGEPNPSLEQTALEQAQANETPEEKAAREATAETPEAKLARETAEATNKEPKPEGVDLTGTVFEGLSPEMQGKVAPFAAVFAENGTLTDAEVSEAANATGFSEAMVRQFMAGATVSASTTAKPLFDAFGGDAPFREFQGWTQEEGNLTPAETKTINKALGLDPNGQPIKGATPDYEMAAQLAQPAMERWKAAGGGAAARDVTRAAQTPPGGDQGDVYESWEQLRKDQSKDEYRRDPAFRAKVEAKIARSPALG